jgi:hypothetical protein
LNCCVAETTMPINRAKIPDPHSQAPSTHPKAIPDLANPERQIVRSEAIQIEGNNVVVFAPFMILAHSLLLSSE